MPLQMPKHLTEAELDDMLRLAEQAGFLVEITGQKAMGDGDPRVYNSFVLTQK